MDNTYTLTEVLLLLDAQKNICGYDYYDNCASDNEVESLQRILSSKYPQTILDKIIENGN